MSVFVDQMAEAAATTTTEAAMEFDRVRASSCNVVMVNRPSCGHRLTWSYVCLNNVALVAICFIAYFVYYRSAETESLDLATGQVIRHFAWP